MKDFESKLKRLEVHAKKWLTSPRKKAVEKYKFVLELIQAYRASVDMVDTLTKKVQEYSGDKNKLLGKIKDLENELKDREASYEWKQEPPKPELIEDEEDW